MDSKLYSKVNLSQDEKQFERFSIYVKMLH
jgi:hypothetical protein